MGRAAPGTLLHPCSIPPLHLGAPPTSSAAPWHPPALLLHPQHPFCALALSCTPVTAPLHPGIHLPSLHPSIHLHSWCTLAPTCNRAAPWHLLLHPCCTMIPSTSASPWHSPAPLLHPGTVQRRAPFTSWFERCCRKLVFGGSRGARGGSASPASPPINACGSCSCWCSWGEGPSARTAAPSASSRGSPRLRTEGTQRFPDYK